ncbi:MAG: glycoside hydrolase family 2 TIM barrel-domain containing protein, partial [Gammaproteobacteria bacterium]
MYQKNKRNYKTYILIIFAFLVNFNTFADTVSVKDSKIYVNGERYYIKGICYHPVPIGKWRRSFATLQDDIALMNEAGINTVRVYEPILDKNVLDTLADNNIKVIVSLGFNQSGLYDINSGTYKVYIN